MWHRTPPRVQTCADRRVGNTAHLTSVTEQSEKGSPQLGPSTQAWPHTSSDLGRAPGCWASDTVSRLATHTTLPSGHGGQSPQCTRGAWAINTEHCSLPSAGRWGFPSQGMPTCPNAGRRHTDSQPEPGARSHRLKGSLCPQEGILGPSRCQKPEMVRVNSQRREQSSPPCLLRDRAWHAGSRKALAEEFRYLGPPRPEQGPHYSSQFPSSCTCSPSVTSGQGTHANGNRPGGLGGTCDRTGAMQQPVLSGTGLVRWGHLTNAPLFFHYRPLVC